MSLLSHVKDLNLRQIVPVRKNVNADLRQNVPLLISTVTTVYKLDESVKLK